MRQPIGRGCVFLPVTIAGIGGLKTYATGVRYAAILPISALPRSVSSAQAPARSRGLFDRAVEALGHEGITDVICLMGFYTSVSMTLAFYDVPAGATGMAR